MPFLEHYVALTLITKSFKLLTSLVKSSIFGTILNTQNVQETYIYLNSSYVCWLDKSLASE